MKQKFARGSVQLEEVEDEQLAIPNPRQRDGVDTRTTTRAHTGLAMTDDEIGASPPSAPNNRYPPLYQTSGNEDVAPGAVAVDLEGRETNPMASEIYDETLTFVSSSPLVPSATLVQEPPAPKVGVADHAAPDHYHPATEHKDDEDRKKKEKGTNPCNRQAFVWIAVALIIAVAAIVVAVIVTRSSNDSTTDNAQKEGTASLPPSPTNSPVLANTAKPSEPTMGSTPIDSPIFEGTTTEAPTGKPSADPTPGPTVSSTDEPSPTTITEPTVTTTLFTGAPTLPSPSGGLPVAFGDGGQWVQDGSDLVGEAEDDWFGGAVSLSADGRRLAVSSISSEFSGGTGYTRVYELAETSGEWIQLGTTIPTAGNRGVTLSGDGLRLATTSKDVSSTAGGSSTGGSEFFVTVFEWGIVPEQWVEVNVIFGLFSDEGSDQSRGTQSLSLSFDGSRIAIGSWQANAVQVFEDRGGSLVRMGDEIVGEEIGDNFGWSVALSNDGNRLAVGAHHNDNDNGVDAGHARIYKWDGSSWEQLGQDIDGEYLRGWCGYSVSLSNDGDRVAVGSFFSERTNGEGGAGTIRIFEWNGSSWSKVGQSINGNDHGDSFGVSTEISGDGLVVVGGATEEANGYSGYVEVHYFDGSEWVMAGQTVRGDGEFGGSVSLSADGRKFVAGARAELYSVLDVRHIEGYAQVYEWEVEA